MTTNCKCGKEITSPNLTGELCTSCFFALRNGSKSLAERALENTPAMMQGKSEQMIETALKEDLPITIIESSNILCAQHEFEYWDRTEANLGLWKVCDKCGYNEQVSYTCEECNELHPIPDSNHEKKCLTTHNPSKPSISNVPNDGKKYCQSCLERGFGLKLATRLWQEDYYICEECFGPLMNNILGIDRAELDKVKTEVRVDSPALTQFYDILQVPEPLRFTSTDHILNHRNDIFNYRATALVNVTREDVEKQIEFMQVMLFHIKVNLEPLTNYINVAKAHERAQANIEGVKKGKKEVGAGPSKVKLSAIEKEAKSFGMTVEKYIEMTKAAKQKEFDKLTGAK